MIWLNVEGKKKWQIILIQFISKLGYCKVVLVTECQSAVCSSRLLVGCHLPLHLPLLPPSPCWGKVGPSGALAGSGKGKKKKKQHWVSYRPVQFASNIASVSACRPRAAVGLSPPVAVKQVDRGASVQPRRSDFCSEMFCILAQHCNSQWLYHTAVKRGF